MDQSKINKEVDATFRKAAEEVCGRELTPNTVRFRVTFTTKEGREVSHTSSDIDVSKK